MENMSMGNLSIIAVIGFLIFVVVVIAAVGIIAFVNFSKKKKEAPEPQEEYYTPPLDVQLSGEESIAPENGDVDLDNWSGVGNSYSGGDLGELCRMGVGTGAPELEPDESGQTVLLDSAREYINVAEPAKTGEGLGDIPLFASDEALGEQRRKRGRTIFYDDDVNSTGDLDELGDIELPKAFVFRLNTEERTEINKPEFSIGKSRNADYTVTGNNTISRLHAVIIYKEDGYFIVDNHSSNKSYINDTLMEPDILYPLKNEDRFMISNEAFVFHTELG